MWTNIPTSAPGETNATSYTVTSLSNGTAYQFRIRAVNPTGNSPQSDASTSVTPQASTSTISPPANAIWSATLTVSEASDFFGCSSGVPVDNCSTGLTDNEFTFGGTNYRVVNLYWNASQLSFGFFGNTKAPERKTALSSLTLNVGSDAYAISAAMAPPQFSELAWGSPPSDISDGDTVKVWLAGAQAATKPAKPTGLTATAGDQQVALSWDDPSDSTITQYQYQQRTGNTWGEWTDIPTSAPGETNATSYTVTSLTNGTAYRFRIRAVNSAGNSPQSEATPTVRPQASADTTGPTISTIAVTSSVASGQAAYKIGDDIEVTATFNEDIVVAGTPKLEITVGSAAKSADCARKGSSGAAKKQLECTYTVLAGDADTDGISVAANKLTLPTGASIKDSSNNDATRTYTAITTQSSHKVDGVKPTISSISITSTPPTTPGSWYKKDNVIKVTATFSEAIVVTGSPTLKINVGGTEKSATCAKKGTSGDDAKKLECSYTVAADDEDADGIAVAAGKLAGTIKDGSANDATLTYTAITAQSGHKVDAKGPTITEVFFFGSTAIAKRGDWIDVRVRFSESINAVTGSPTIAVQVGTQTRTFTYTPGGSDHLVKVFHYQVQTGDNDADGISVPAGSIILPAGAALNDDRGNAATLTHTGKTGGRKVDATVPGIEFPESPAVPRLNTASTITLTDTVAKIKKYGAIVVDGTTGTAANCDTAAEIGTTNLTTETTPKASVNFPYTPPSGSVGKKICVYAEDAVGNSDSGLWDTAIQQAPTEPTVSSIAITSTVPEGQDGKYKIGDVVKVEVTFNKDIEVTGTPTLKIKVGTAEKSASCARKGSAGDAKKKLECSYTVAEGDADSDGIAVEAGKLTGTVKDGSNNAATLTYTALGNQSAHKVDGVRPTVTRLEEYTGSAGPWFTQDESIIMRAVFSEAVVITGVTRIAAKVGANTRQFSRRDTSGSNPTIGGENSNTGHYTYTVVAGDSDADGISVDAGSITLVGSATIKDDAGNAMASPAAHPAMSAQSEMRVDTGDPGIAFPVSPAVPRLNTASTITLTDSLSKVAKYAVLEVAGTATDATGCDDPSTSGDSFSTTTVSPAASPKTVQHTPLALGKKLCVYAEDVAGNSHSALWNTAILQAPAKPKVTLVLGSTTINESGSGNATTIKATLPSAPSAAVAVTLTLNPASGVVALGGTTLTIPTTGTDSNTVTVTAVDNSVEAADATVTISGSVSSTAPATAPDAVKLTVTDDEGSAIAGLAAEPLDGAVNLTWTNPSTCTAAAPACSYQYRYRLAGGTWSAWAGTSSLAAQQVGHLRGGTAYEFEVRRRQGGTTLAEGSVSAATTGPAVPARPKGLTASAGDRQVTIAWDDPKDASITGYQVKYGPSARQISGSWQDIPNSAPGGANATSWTVTGLQNGTEYLFWVRAGERQRRELRVCRDRHAGRHCRHRAAGQAADRIRHDRDPPDHDSPAAAQRPDDPEVPDRSPSAEHQQLQGHPRQQCRFHGPGRAGPREQGVHVHGAGGELAGIRAGDGHPESDAGLPGGGRQDGPRGGRVGVHGHAGRGAARPDVEGPASGRLRLRDRVGREEHGDVEAVRPRVRGEQPQAHHYRPEGGHGLRRAGVGELRPGQHTERSGLQQRGHNDRHQHPGHGAAGAGERVGGAAARAGPADGDLRERAGRTQGQGQVHGAGRVQRGGRGRSEGGGEDDPGRRGHAHARAARGRRGGPLGARHPALGPRRGDGDAAGDDGLRGGGRDVHGGRAQAGDAADPYRAGTAGAQRGGRAGEGAGERHHRLPGESLSRAAAHEVTVRYATRDGTAKKGSDYRKARGTLAFAPGETAKTVAVEIIDDAHNENLESFKLVLSKAKGAHIADGEATGQVVNSDPLQQAWLARFGRAAATDAIAAVTARLETPRGAGSYLTFAGQRLDFSGDGAALAETLTGLARAFGAPGTPADDEDPFARHGLANPWSDPVSAPARRVTAREAADGDVVPRGARGRDWASMDGLGPGRVGVAVLGLGAGAQPERRDRDRVVRHGLRARPAARRVRDDAQPR